MEDLEGRSKPSYNEAIKSGTVARRRRRNRKRKRMKGEGGGGGGGGE